MRETQWVLDTPGGQYSLALMAPSRSLLRGAHDPSVRSALEAWLMAARRAGRARWLMGEVGRVLARPLARESANAEVLVRTAFTEGRLRLERLPDRVPHGRDEKLETFAHDGTKARDDLTWIAIRLEYDDDSGQGVAYARYVVKLPDGETREGQLDRDGNARLDGLHPGMCEVTFPEYDSRKGAPPAKVPPGKGHQPRKPKNGESGREPFAAGAAIRCRATAINLFDRLKKPIKRKPSEQKVLQVVAVPTRKRSFEGTASAGLSSIDLSGKHSDEKTDESSGVKNKREISVGSKEVRESEERTDATGKRQHSEEHAISAEQVTDLLKQWRSAPDFKSFVRSVRAEQERPAEDKSSAHDPALEVTASGTLYTGGFYPVRASLARTPECGRPHPVLVSGGLDATLATIDDLALLKWQGEAERQSKATPTSYSVNGRGCEGDDSVVIEVFPGEQHLYAGSMTLDVGGSKLFSGVAGVVAKALGQPVEVSWSAKGTIDVFSGWREEEEDWWVSHCSEVALAGAWMPKAKVTLPLLPLVTKVVPSSLLRYIANAELELELEGGIKVSGTFTDRTAPAKPSRTGSEGEAEIEGSLDFSAKPRVSVGKDDVLGASLSGEFKAEGAIAGSGKYEEDAVQFTLQASSKEGKIKFVVLTTALVWKAEWNWEYTLWKDVKTKPWETDPWPVHGSSRSTHGR
jgi:hypothetical protein